ncbi:MAG: DUF2156 domain-containing protein [Synergistaceae bacterium]|nr:DUF2156 domain-containing protein [Synergistaceae bacterium]
MKTFIHPLTLETKALYDSCAGFLPGAVTSPLYFQGLYAWNFVSVNRYEIFGRHLCIAAEDKMRGEIFALPPLGELGGKSFALAVYAILDAFEREGLPCVFREVPGFMLPHFSAVEGYRAEVGYDRNCSEYVFTLDDLAEGLQKSAVRTERRSFERKFNPRAREITPSDKDAVRAVTQKFFCSEMACSNCFYGCELEVESRIMESWDELGMKGVIIESEKEAKEALAFGIVCFQKDTAFFISKKICRRTRGLDAYLTAAMMDRLFDAEHRYVNYSDDLGNEGLRNYKSGLGKHTLMHRYVVRLLK